ncbi:MAG: maltokinase N-terminal cap-like domain-containing protein, partial [Friedmanniella sp.]
MPSPTPEVADQILAHVTASRWFGGKGRRATVVGVTPLPWLTPLPEYFDSSAGPAVRLEVVELAYPDGPDADEPSSGRPDEDLPDDDRDVVAASTPDGPLDQSPRELYQLALAYRPAPHPDLQQAEIGRWTDADLGTVVVYDATQDPQSSAVLLRSLLAEEHLRAPDAELGFHLSAAQGLTADLQPSVFRGQQSNTSVMFGDVAMLKLFRRLELGRTLDLEVHDALSRSGMADVARLFGWA